MGQGQGKGVRKASGHWGLMPIAVGKNKLFLRGNGVRKVESRDEWTVGLIGDYY